MSTKVSILWHWNEKDRVGIHIFEDVVEAPPNNIFIEISTDHAKINVAWPLDLSLADVQKLAISAAESTDKAACSDNNHN